MQRAAWTFVILLLAVDILLLVQRAETNARLQDLGARSAVARLKVKYAAEEEALLTRAGSVPARFPRLQSDETAADTVEFCLLVSTEDCTNCIEDEVAKLNELAREGPARLAGIQGFFVDDDREERAQAFIQHLSPNPSFPMAVRDAISLLPGATTPLVLVLRSRDGKILDAHKPIPEDLSKRDAFYARWAAALGLS